MIMKLTEKGIIQPTLDRFLLKINNVENYNIQIYKYFNDFFFPLNTPTLFFFF